MHSARLNFLIILFLICLGCTRETSLNEIEDLIDNEFALNFGDRVTRDIFGLVVDTQDVPIYGATVEVGDRIVQTDQNGVFIVKNANVYERFGYIKVRKDGYLNGSRSISTAIGTNNVKISLLRKEVFQTVPANSPATLELPNGASLELPGGYRDEGGSSYNGLVNVVLHYLEPNDRQTINRMPGMLYGQDLNGREATLVTFGMMAIELLGSAGQPLNLQDGQEATLSFPVDPSTSGGPEVIPLWYFDEVNGYWREEGEARLNGDRYVGTVTHFSFWNCDINLPTVELCIQVSDNNNNPLTNQLISLTFQFTSGFTSTSFGRTNNLGWVCGRVPQDFELELNALLEECLFEPFYTESIGPFNSNFSFNLTLPELPEVQAEMVAGNLFNCDNMPVTNGYATFLYSGNNMIQMVDNGNFQFNIVRCNTVDQFYFEGVDQDNDESTGLLLQTFTTPSTNLGILNTCNALVDYLSLTHDDISVLYTYNESYASWYADTSIFPDGFFNFYASRENTFDYHSIGISVGGNEIGTYSGNDLRLAIVPPQFDGKYFCSPNDTNCSNIVVEITQIGEVGEHMVMNFSGSYIDFDGTEHTFSGDAVITRGPDQ